MCVHSTLNKPSLHTHIIIGQVRKSYSWVRRGSELIVLLRRIKHFKHVGITREVVVIHYNESGA
jgi:hypothetical protein